MKKCLLFAGVACAMALMAPFSARADVWVDKPSFGRIVYGMTGGACTLPADAWQGYYPDGSGTAAVPGDITFGGGPVVVGAQVHYAGDLAPVAARDWAWVNANPGAVNATPYLLNTFTNGVGGPQDKVWSVKLGFISDYGWESEVKVHKATGVKPGAMTTLIPKHTNAAAGLYTATVNDPFSFAYVSAGAGATPPYAYYMENPAWNTGTAANKLYSHVKAYHWLAGSTDVWFLGFEDWNFDSPGGIANGYHRFDWNDTVIAMTYAVPEPAFYQMLGLFGLGALGLAKARRRA